MFQLLARAGAHIAAGEQIVSATLAEPVVARGSRSRSARALIDLRSMMVDQHGRAVEYVEMLALPERLQPPLRAAAPTQLVPVPEIRPKIQKEIVMSQAAKFRAMLKSGKMIVAPGAIDCITGRLIDQAGFAAVYMTGAGTSATLGYPDYGLITMTEMVANASRIANSISIPLISDSDTGYGNELNMFRTVQEFERAGVAAIHVEDQVFPKKCGHLDNKELVSREDYIAKIRAAAAAKRSPDFTIIARTDSRAVVGFDEAIDRANLGAGQRRRRGLRRGAADHGRGRAGAEAGQGPVPAEHGARRQDAGDRRSPTPSAWATRSSILPGLLLGNIIAICDQTLAEVKRLGKFPPPLVRVLAGQDVRPLRRRRLGCPPHRLPRRPSKSPPSRRGPCHDRPADDVREDLATPRRRRPAGRLHAALCRPSPDA